MSSHHDHRDTCRSPAIYPSRKSLRYNYSNTSNEGGRRWSFDVESVTRGSVIENDIFLESRTLVSPSSCISTPQKSRVVSQREPEIFDEWMQTLPFHVQYEISRLSEGNPPRCLLNEMSKLHRTFDSRSKVADICNCLYSFYGKKKGYCSLLNSRVPFSDFHYSGDFKNKAVILRQPKLSKNCRVMRKFGADRFFDLFVTSDIHISILDEVFSKCINIGGRKYRLLWVDVAKSPQCYVLFAESGADIDQFISVDDVSNFCFPLSLNLGTTISKKIKRMKLSFSTTVPSGVLPRGSLCRIPDLYRKNCKGEKIVMTDGCGLVSREGIDYIWREYTRARIEYAARFGDEYETEILDCCPYSSFQARIGPLKGMWVLDESLGDGIKLHYRDSQKKFNLPMKSCDNPRIEGSFDDYYDTVEVCKWSKTPKVNHLSIRLIQILEERGVSVDYVIDCAKQSLTWANGIFEDDERLISFLKHELSNSSYTRRSPHLNDDDLLWNLARAGVSKSERFFAILLQACIKKKLDGIRCKANYPVQRSAYLHMIPDHYGILEPDEVYIPLCNDMITLERTREVIAIRYPAFITTDLLKLKIVTRKELRFRCGLNLVMDLYGNFYENLQNCVVISTKLYQGRCVADIMSGGDYDGDQAWISWDPNLVQQVKPSNFVLDIEEAEDQPISRKVDCGNILDIVLYAYACRDHSVRLGTICNRLDCAIDLFGFDHPISRSLAKKGFIQVDNPSCKNGYLSRLADPKKKPHWKKQPVDQDDDLIVGTDFCKEIYSGKILGIVWNYLEAMTPPQMIDSQVNKYIKSKVEDGLKYDERKVYLLRDEVRKACVLYNRKCQEYFDSLPTIPNNSCDAPLKIDMNFWWKTWSDVRNILIDSKRNEDDKLLAAALLYEAVEGAYIQDERDRMSSVLKQEYYTKKYSLAWRVAHDYLTRIVADGESYGYGAGIVVSRNLIRYL